MTTIDISAIAKGIQGSDKKSVSQALNLVEDKRAVAHESVAALLEAIHDAPKARAGHRVGLTGPPGVGKSTLAAALARELRTRGRTVGVVAVDPSSVWSGGSLLGDRARMAFDPADDGLFIRSLATGGEAGGLSYAANSAVRVLAAAFDVVLVETTGVGQTETDVMHVADTVVLVVQPGSGDVLQFLKAGIMEIPDVLVVNKSDHAELAQRAISDLRGAIRTASAAGVAREDHAASSSEGEDATWETPIIATSAQQPRGVDDLADALDRHRAHLGPSLAYLRQLGAAHWALQLFARKHGEHGLLTLGGAAAVQSRIEGEIAQGQTPLGLCEQLSREYVRALGQERKP